MKKGIFERCLSADINETMRKIEAELELLEAEVLRAVTDNGLKTQLDDVALLMLLEPLVAELHRSVSNDPRAKLLYRLVKAAITVTVANKDAEGDHHV